MWYILCMCLCALSSAAQATVSEQPHSFFMPRPLSTYTHLTYGGDEQLDDADRLLSITHTALYSVSTEEEEAVPYFFGKGKSSLRVDQSENGDLNSDWFHIENASGKTYKSYLSIHPEREVWGIAMRMRHSLSAVYDGLWMAVSVPFVQVNHNLKPTEILDDSTAVASSSVFASVLKTLDWNNWRAGKWSEKSQTISGVDDIGMQVGITRSGAGGSTHQAYAHVTIPVNGFPTGQYLFEPIIGSAGSCALGGGVVAITPLVTGQAGMSLELINHVEYRYHFSVHHQRTPDLKGQPFSRYLVLMDTGLIDNDANVGTKAANGVNFVTRDCLVTPGATGSSSHSIRLKRGNHGCVLGYSYWWRGAEQVQFSKASLRSFAAPWKDGLVGSDQAWLPAPRITDAFIENDASKTTSPSVLYDLEFDMESAAAPYTASHTVFAHYDAHWNTSIGQWNFTFGGSYEIADNCAALSSWQLWCGIGITS